MSSIQQDEECEVKGVSVSVARVLGTFQGARDHGETGAYRTKRKENSEVRSV